jgi:ATP-dependent protease HslVU (ClpYQ) peptidase subunit
MTCIVGLEENGRVYIGADSAAVAGFQVRASRTPKVFRKGEYTIAYTSSFRMGQILAHQVDYPLVPEGGASEEFMVTEFCESVRKALKESGYSSIENNVESGGSFLVGVRGKLYHVDSDFQVNHYIDGIAADGCGREYALGAIRALSRVEPLKRMYKALEISSYFSGGVIAPFKVMEA